MPPLNPNMRKWMKARARAARFKVASLRREKVFPYQKINENCGILFEAIRIPHAKSIDWGKVDPALRWLTHASRWFRTRLIPISKRALAAFEQMEGQDSSEIRMLAEEHQMMVNGVANMDELIAEVRKKRAEAIN